MNRIKLKNFGPIQEADIKFGDLTIFVGQQASGKSVLLQLVKLLEDKKHIRKTLEQYGFTWGNEENAILDKVFGESMSALWTDKTKIEYDEKTYQKSYVLSKQKEKITEATETVFYIPAQRVVCLQNGWPRFFTEYDYSVPYVLRQFSETLRQLLDNPSNREKEQIFPQKKLLKALLRESFNHSIFHGGEVVLDNSDRKRFKLRIGDTSLPFMTWSAGQKEFMPLLLSFYWLCPPAKVSTKDNLQSVIIEEPEMGLHPQAIQSILLQIIDLISRGYKVIVSTHSPVILEFAWAFQFLQKNDPKDTNLPDLFNLSSSASILGFFKGFLKEKIINTYYFNRVNNTVFIKNISSLDAGSEDESIAEWGGLSSFSTKASDLVSMVTSNG